MSSKWRSMSAYTVERWKGGRDSNKHGTARTNGGEEDTRQGRAQRTKLAPAHGAHDDAPSVSAVMVHVCTALEKVVKGLLRVAVGDAGELAGAAGGNRQTSSGQHAGLVLGAPLRRRHTYNVPVLGGGEDGRDALVVRKVDLR